MYLNSIYCGLKVVPISVLWGQSTYYLCTWTLTSGIVQDPQSPILVIKARTLPLFQSENPEA